MKMQVLQNSCVESFALNVEKNLELTEGLTILVGLSLELLEVADEEMSA